MKCSKCGKITRMTVRAGEGGLFAMCQECKDTVNREMEAAGKNPRYYVAVIWKE